MLKGRLLLLEFSTKFLEGSNNIALYGIVSNFQNKKEYKQEEIKTTINKSGFVL
jgi:hypothetical protein